MKRITAHIKQKEIKQVKIDTDYIKLDAFLKLAGIVMTGGHAKAIITEKGIKVNGEISFARGKKLHKGDKVEFENTVYEVI